MFSPGSGQAQASVLPIRGGSIDNGFSGVRFLSEAALHREFGYVRSEIRV